MGALDAEETVRAMIGLARDPAFVALRARAKAAPLPRAEFDLLPMPQGYPAEGIWDLLNSLRMQTAVSVPCDDARGRRGWYSVTNSIMEDCDAIDRLCCRGSRLDAALRTHDPVSLMLGPVVDELVAVMATDGMRLGHEEARGVASGSSRPESPAQQVAANAVGVLYGTDALAKGPVDAHMVVEVRRRLTRHVGSVPKAAPPRPNEARRRICDLWRSARMPYEQALDTVVRIASGRGVDPAEHPLLRCLAIDDVVVPGGLFADLSATTSWLVSRALLVRSGLPALAFAPVHHLASQWEYDLVRPPSNDMAYADSVVEAGDTVDFTGNIAGTVELVRCEVEAMDARVARAVSSEEEAEGRLMTDLRLNHRQRDVVLRALRDPNATFRVASHQRAFRVAYATARADLLGLESLGLLERHEGGRAFEFTPRRGLERLLR